MEYMMTTVTEIKSMKLSKETIEVLKNFASINSNILVNPGDTLTTVSPVKNVLAEAKVPESFPIQFGLWDLNKFLGVVSLFQDPEFVFDEKFDIWVFVGSLIILFGLILIVKKKSLKSQKKNTCAKDF